MTNVAPTPAVVQNTVMVTATDEVTETVEVQDEAENQERQEPSSSTASTAPKRKCQKSSSTMLN